MSEAVLPGVSIRVIGEGLIVPGRVTVGRLGVVGTASKGPVGIPVILGSYLEAREVFGDYDPWVDGLSDELTLVRALELAYANGATTAFAVRVAGAGVATASATLNSAGGECVLLTAKSGGTWGADVQVTVAAADEDAMVTGEEHLASDPPPITLAHTPIASARNRVRVFSPLTGTPASLRVVYGTTVNPDPGEVHIAATGVLTFGDPPDTDATITVSYLVSRTDAVKVTLSDQGSEEAYTVVDGAGLVAAVNSRVRPSALVVAAALVNAAETPEPVVTALTGGANGEAGANYAEGLEALLNEAAHIIVAAGQDETFGDELDAHCQNASGDAVKRDRIAVVGSGVGATLDSVRGHPLFSDRVIFADPGIRTTDSAASPPAEVTLPGAYAAAAVAGLLAKLPAHFSPTNKTLSVGGLAVNYTPAQLAQLVESRVMVIEQRRGVRVVKGITTSDPPFHQVTTRRIVDFAKFGVRSAADPYIGLLNNERVRGALRATINSFLTNMVNDEMLVSYELDVTATRDEERQGIARVTMVLLPTFCIDFIQCTIHLA